MLTVYIVFGVIIISSIISIICSAIIIHNDLTIMESVIKRRH